MKKDFNKTALHSSLFKGHTVWYFVYLKTEKLAHVLNLLRQRSPAPAPLFDDMAREAARVPHTVVRVLSGELKEEVILASVFSLLSTIRLLSTREEIGKENAGIILQEYERVVERIAEAATPWGLLISAEHLTVSTTTEEEVAPVLPVPAGAAYISSIKDNKGQYKSHVKDSSVEAQRHESQAERMSVILEIIRKNNGISIKGISAVVRDCSEKTIQRELGTLIERGLVVREGERRWSIYKPSPFN